MREHFKVYGIGWFVVHMVFFCCIMLMSVLSYLDWFTDRQIMYVCLVSMALWLLEGILGLIEDLKNVHRSIDK